MAQGTQKGRHEPYAPIRPRVVEPRTSTTPPQASQIDRGTCLLHKDPSTHSLDQQGWRSGGAGAKGMGALLKFSGVALSHGNA